MGTALAENIALENSKRAQLKLKLTECRELLTEVRCSSRNNAKTNWSVQLSTITTKYISQAKRIN
jgi:hypothetical protein